VEELKSRVDKGTIEEIRQSEADIKKLDDEYHERLSRKWIFMIVGALFCGLATYFMDPVITPYLSATYNREGIESICKDKFGDIMLTETLADEVVIVSFEFNTHTPFLWTKYNAI